MNEIRGTEREMAEAKEVPGKKSMVDSTSDNRTINNSTRQQDRVLSDEEKFSVDWFKTKGEEIIQQLEGQRTVKPEAGREFSLAITHMEDAVMRAIRGITQ